MGNGFASGKYAIALCDRCSQQFKLLQLKKEWTGFKVCEECYDPKHPQLEPRRNIGDAIALFEPRPSPKENMDVPVGGVGDTAINSIGMMPMPLAKQCAAFGTTGTVRVQIT